ncbi:hypothetical protein JMA_27330 [Jeotgalibacillus malaysiensis]|uniref:Uncharacterized protein n=1 Tax=Jeotgalibacillus malaysiensis TaxID=1508404 RepID=A0A0B5AP53_9BACL|nr:hypothetical protein [Jeotgalibacillus malaysiensis]AJD92050.1 hypothetical protein JMA_27330 [Jeotgalibacillus malaysiensis]
MNAKFNTNYPVKVKLTDYGIQVLRERHQALNQNIIDRGGKGLGEFELRLDDEGYYRTQMWMLIEKFGYPANMLLNPFDANIILEGVELLDGSKPV